VSDSSWPIAPKLIFALDRINRSLTAPNRTRKVTRYGPPIRSVCALTRHPSYYSGTLLRPPVIPFKRVFTGVNPKRKCAWTYSDLRPQGATKTPLITRKQIRKPNWARAHNGKSILRNTDLTRTLKNLRVLLWRCHDTIV